MASSRSPSVPLEWVVKQSKTRGGKVYYNNTVTGASTWKKPSALTVIEETTGPRKAKKRHHKDSVIPAKQPNLTSYSSHEKRLRYHSNLSPEKRPRYQLNSALTGFSHLSDTEKITAVKYPSEKGISRKITNSTAKNGVEFSDAVEVTSQKKRSKAKRKRVKRDAKRSDSSKSESAKQTVKKCAVVGKTVTATVARENLNLHKTTLTASDYNSHSDRLRPVADHPAVVGVIRQGSYSSTAASTAQRITARPHRRKKNGKKQTDTTTQEVFHTENESKAKFCGIGQNSAPPKPPKVVPLHKTIEVLRPCVAHNINPLVQNELYSSISSSQPVVSSDSFTDHNSNFNFENTSSHSWSNKLNNTNVLSGASDSNSHSNRSSSSPCNLNIPSTSTGCPAILNDTETPLSNAWSKAQMVGDEDMEIDQEGTEILTNLQDVRLQTSSMSNEAMGVLTETITKVYSDVTNGPVVVQRIVLVVDTNILISCMKFLQGLLIRSISDHGKPLLVLPWVVMQELDYLKNGKSKETCQRAAAAVRFIHSCLVAKNPNLIGQTPLETSEEAEITIECNDDRILHCCLQCKKTYVNSHVILLTRDVNLSNKALIMGIPAASNETLWSHLNTDKPSTNSQWQITSGKAVPDVKVTGVSEAKVKPEMHVTEASSNKEEHLEVDSDKTDADVLSKFESVWKLIFDIRCELNTVLVQGKFHANYAQAAEMVQTVVPLLLQLRDDFDGCLSLSPVILLEHKEEFNTLCSSLNSFHRQAHVSSPDSSQPVTAMQLLTHFHVPKNRVTLYTGLEQLSALISDFMQLSQLCSS